ncbi:histidine kinase/DNA gyrase B/HSP90-like ATPase [Aminivibrio pyruvatiphilus]|jgi:signal transduction histidine kinase|uniref:histidine kinase n=1 Tax=Aminivibrio pyruvatiphilus TaxID=1005740 RepID=A0A4R8MCC5_9BACT|nr:histidine kinase [Aminivibrio pyruvatiphilus]TDY61932.1 histidine kinase/DNA gyrase B/HSP90-like ATPase [Aminivibrio pyruvatiphilus]
MRRHLLLIITFAILLPALAVLLVSGFGLMQHEWAMESVARSYVQDMAENVASRLAGIETRKWGSELTSIEIRRFRVFTWGPSLPGWVAVVAADGRILFSSPGADNLAAIWRPNIPIGRAVEIKDREGNLYTIAVNPVSGGDRYVIAAVAWDQLLGPLVRVGRLWPILILLMAVGILLALWALWKWLIVPLRDLVEEIETLRWGKDLPALPDPVAVSEIGSLRTVLYRLARTAVERTLLRNRYVNDIVRVQEGEKSRIARELHDGPIQNITAMIQQIRLSRMAGNGEGMHRHLAIAEETAQVVVRELREMCDELSPPWIDLGLEQAMTELANRLARHYNIFISMDVDDSVELGRERLLSLFRIFQEGVSNAVRHGQATEMRAEVFRKGEAVVFEFHDNGKGFEPDMNYETLRVEGHRGLANMLERMMLVGGRLEVESVPGNGALVRCVMPDIPEAAAV